MLMTKSIGEAGVHAPQKPARNNQPANPPTNATILRRTMADDPPPIKPWGKANKEFLQELINEGKVDIRRTSDVRYIDRIRVKYFRERDVQNFRRNFRTYARSRELEDQISGYRRQQSEYCLFIFIIKLLLTPPTSPIL